MDLSEKKLKKQYEKNLKVLHQLSKGEGNKTCADCLASSPKWASANIGVFLCLHCAGLHRKMGSQISNIKSITLDNWTNEEIQIMMDNGNVQANLIYLNGSHKPLEADFEYIRNKYERKAFAKKEKSDKELLSILENMGFTKTSRNKEALALAGGDVQKAVELLLLSGSGGDSEESTSKKKSPKKENGAEFDDRLKETSLPKLHNKHLAVNESTDSIHLNNDQTTPLDKKLVNESNDDKKLAQEEKVQLALKNAMDQLASFGFTDQGDTRAALRQARGDIQKALNILSKWRDEKIDRENIYLQQKHLEAKKSNQNLLHSMENIGQSKSEQRVEANSQQHFLPNGNQFAENHTRFEDKTNFTSTQQSNIMPIQQQRDTWQPHYAIDRFNQDNIHMQGSDFGLMHTPLQNSQAMPIQTQAMAVNVPALQNPLDIFDSDPFSFPSSVNVPALQPSVKGKQPQNASKFNPFISQPIPPSLPSQISPNIFESYQTNVINTVANPRNDLDGISFDITPMKPTTTNKTQYPISIQNSQILNLIPQEANQPAKSSKDQIMSLFSGTNPLPIQNNPFTIAQSTQPLRSQPRLSLVKNVNPNPFMTNFSIAGTYTNSGHQINQTSIMHTDMNSRNYNYSAADAALSDIFSAPAPPPSDKDRIQASLFADLKDFRK